jgi:dCMP deaminase
MVETPHPSLDWRPLLRLAATAALSSPDPTTQNGALLVSGTTALPTTFSCNDFPTGVDYSLARWSRPLKYDFVEHAERNAIYAAARQGISTLGLTLVCYRAACADCARAIIQAGIARLVTVTPDQKITNPRWTSSILSASSMLQEAGIEVIYLDGPLGEVSPIRRNGSLIDP